MKNVIKYVLFFVILVGGETSFAQTPCPAWGSVSKTSDTGALNTAKNKPVTIPKAAAESVALTEILAKPTGADKDRFDKEKGKYISTEGYIVSFVEEGPESCNCKEAVAKDKTGDLHVYIGETATAAKNECMIVEFTPKFKAAHKNYAGLVAKGEHVRVSGYLIYDFEHERNALNTCKKCTGTSIWRKTCWEIHPVLKMEKLAD